VVFGAQRAFNQVMVGDAVAQLGQHHDLSTCLVLFHATMGFRNHSTANCIGRPISTP
jgi:hypothetical protein